MENRENRESKKVKNKPGIPNEGDTVKIVELGRCDSHYRPNNSSDYIGFIGTVSKVEKISPAIYWSFYLTDKKEIVTCFVDAKVRILKRKKGGE